MLLSTKPSKRTYKGKETTEEYISKNSEKIISVPALYVHGKADFVNSSKIEAIANMRFRIQLRRCAYEISGLSNERLAYTASIKASIA